MVLMTAAGFEDQTGEELGLAEPQGVLYSTCAAVVLLPCRVLPASCFMSHTPQGAAVVCGA
jgi:hypothetical protein